MGWTSGEKTSKYPSNLEQLSYASESFVLALPVFGPKPPRFWTLWSNF